MIVSEEVHTLAGPYALDALAEDERILFEQHLPQCAVCTAEVAEFREAAARLSAEIAVAPPAGMREALMASITQVEQLPALPKPDESGAEPELSSRRQRFGRRSLLALAAALVIVAGAGGIAVDQYRKNAATQRANEQIAVVLGQSDARTFHGSLAGGGRTTVVASASRDSAVVVLSDLPALSSGKTYQLWLIDSAKTAHSVGLAGADASSRTRVLAGGVTGKVAFGVTVEPEGGSAQPTMPAAVIVPLTA
ncbi:anti-sigma factor [Kribbella sp. CA-293567]|uniref:anti-sigma factor n=1 Tax=Kribbella sp. CA-293567 TaxID=3002436 RepID=UPI0022DDA052|nr:anti-sigma factor [Kribbella sp. CA-293567]WBQ07940.1 anti-sigma factor [Kribbella sp. CA-293567]